VNRPDVVVIGAGIVGSAAAYFLTRAGVRTLVVDRGGASAGSSSGCMGHLMLMSAPESMYRLSRHSLELWKQFHRDVGGFEMLHCGCLWLGESELDMPLLQTMHDEIAAYGDTGQLLGTRELLAREPALAKDLVGAYFYPEDAVIFPMQATAAMLGAVVRQGGETRFGTNVIGLRRAADGSVRSVVTDGGEIETDAVVIAAGVWAPDITEMAGLPRASIFPRRGDLAITMPQDQRVKTQMVEVGYLRTATGKAPDPEDIGSDAGACALNLQPQGNGTLLVGSTRQFSGYDRRVNTRLLRASFERAARFVPCLEDLQIVRTWAGLRPYTRDKVPVLGPCADVPGLFVTGGHEGLGITLSMASGELVAQAVRGATTTQSLAPFLLSRFSEVVHDG
jgi:D-hydroxyproline dehydrogenase subunit beta